MKNLLMKFNDASGISKLVGATAAFVAFVAVCVAIEGRYGDALCLAVASVAAARVAYEFRNLPPSAPDPM